MRHTLFRTHGYTLLEVLVVLAIVSLTTSAAFGVLRQTRVQAAPTAQTQIAAVIARSRAQAIRSGQPLSRTLSDLLPDQMCSEGKIIFYPDGSVLADDLCIISEEVNQQMSISPLSGQLGA